IKSRADRDATVLVAEAKRDSEIIRGDGDAERNKIFAEAFGADPDFFAFYRSMQAYEAGLQSGDTSLVLSPDSSFFRFFKDPAGAALPGSGDDDGTGVSTRSPSLAAQ
ncbi:MAG: protease modulator HflC, partial [Rhodobacteraceae bacterium]|nr:protease modulator HflC [Paracoccaceae bacterium]